jgi:hypothetical protein
VLVKLGPRPVSNGTSAQGHGVAGFPRQDTFGQVNRQRGS